MAKSKSLTSDEMMAAILSYLGILVIIPLLAIKKRNDFMLFHIRQGIALLVVWAILWVISWVLIWIPVFGWMILSFYWVLYLALLIVDIIALVKAIGGEMWVIPIIGERAKDIKIG